MSSMKTIMNAIIMASGICASDVGGDVRRGKYQKPPLTKKQKEVRNKNKAAAKQRAKNRKK